MRTFAFLLLMTAVAWAQTPSLPSVNAITVNAQAPLPPDWLVRAMATVPQCTADLSNSYPPPRKMEIELRFSGGHVFVSEASISRSSGNRAFDQQVVTCLRNLPPEVAAKQSADLTLDLQIFLTNGAISLASSPPTMSPPAPLSLSATTAPASIGHPHACDHNLYPVAALQIGAEGTTRLAFKITSQGSVRDIVVQNSSGNPDLDAASITCASPWQYRPATKDGKPVEVEWRANIKWMLSAPGPFGPIDDAVRQCVSATEIGRKERNQATLHTVLKVHFSMGVISNVVLVASSGITDLDQRVADCQKRIPPEMAAAVPGELDTLFVFY